MSRARWLMGAALFLARAAAVRNWSATTAADLDGDGEAEFAREDDTIPQHEYGSWELFRTFRTNIQIENGGVCDPPIE